MSIILTGLKSFLVKTAKYGEDGEDGGNGGCERETKMTD